MSERPVVMFDAYEYAVWQQGLHESIGEIMHDLDKMIAANNAALAALREPLPQPKAKPSWWRRLLHGRS